MEMLEKLLTNPKVQEALVTALLTLVGLVVPLILKSGADLLKQVRRDRQYAQFLVWVESAVQMAEQLGLTGQLDALYKSKKDAAVATLQNSLDKAGYNWINLDMIVREIEAALRRGAAQPQKAFVTPLLPSESPFTPLIVGEGPALTGPQG